MAAAAAAGGVADRGNGAIRADYSRPVPVSFHFQSFFIIPRIDATADRIKLLIIINGCTEVDRF
jgi:hypothetical protein